MSRETNEKTSFAQQNVLLEQGLPPVYDVIVLNDDYTPMDFVVEILQKFFGHPYSVANALMLNVHQHGQAVCGSYPKDIAQTKVAQVMEIAAQHNYPLLLTVVPRAVDWEL